jgi:hypothetical protein
MVVDNQPTELKNSQNTPKMPVITIDNTNGITTHTPVIKNVAAAQVVALVKRLLGMCLLSIFLSYRSIVFANLCPILCKYTPKPHKK